MKLIQNQKGVAMVEFAIALPLILLLLFGTIEFGVLFYNKQVITNASREGARAVIAKEYDDDDAKLIMINYANNKLIGLNGSVAIDPDDITINITINTPDALNDYEISINVTYTFLYSQIIGLGSSIDISASTTMRMEPTITSG